MPEEFNLEDLDQIDVGLNLREFSWSINENMQSGFTV